MANRIAYIHVMKTAGSFVNRHLTHSLRRPRGFRWYNEGSARTGIPRQGRTGDWSPDELEWIRLRNDPKAYVHNHSIGWDASTVQRFHASGWFTFAFYRHPGDQWCSFFFWSRDRGNSVHTPHLTLDEFLDSGWSEDPLGSRYRAILDLPDYWRELGYVSVFTEDRFRDFLDEFLRVRYAHSNPMNESSNRGYEYYRKSGEISEKTHSLLLESTRYREFLELSESPWRGPSHAHDGDARTTTRAAGRGSARPLRLGVYTTMTGMRWGGSEELWSQAAHTLLSRGHEVHVNAPHWHEPAAPLVSLEAKGARVEWRRRRALYGRSVRRALVKLKLDHRPHMAWLARARPSFVLINAGYHLDDMSVSSACQTLGIPYAVLLQAAGSPHWVHSPVLETYRRVYQGAARCFFVSEENLEIVESNLGALLRNAEIVDNPVRNRVEGRLPWPSEETLRIACVGRLHFQSKGQDLLVRVLRAPKWRDRDLTVHIFGEDQGNEQQLRDLIRLSNLEDKLFVEGYADDIGEVWAHHHALLLPSRYEGSSLAVAEAMCAGRVPILTDVGRNRELVEDGHSGFIAAAPVPSLIDDALERAWQRRKDWPEIGERSARRLREIYSPDPAGDFATALELAASAAAAATSLQSSSGEISHQRLSAAPAPAAPLGVP